MSSFANQMQEYRRQLRKGMIQQAYKGLMEYMLALRTHFARDYPEYSVSGGLYSGYMDMTYFAVVPPSLGRRKLKVAIVFVHEACRFEVWLAGANKQIQTKYWQVFKESGWKKYPIVSSTKDVDAIVEFPAVDEPDFADPGALTRQIEKATLKFIGDVEGFLAGRRT